MPAVNTNPDSPNKFKYTPYSPVTTATDTAVVIVFFNFAQSIRLIQNLLLVKQSLAAANIPAYYAEIAYGDIPFILTPDAANVYQTRTDSYMFYKENLINVMVADRIPANYTKIVAIDADIMFGAPDWYATVSADLDKYDVIQPYSYAENMNANYTCGHRLYPILLKESHAIHPGYAWGFRREWLAANRLYPFAVIGGGDNATAALVIGGKATLPQHMSVQKDSFAKWMGGVPGPRAKTGISNIPIYHLPHGTAKNRQYIKRHDRIRSALAQCGVTNIEDAIEIRADGIMEWIPAVREKMNVAMREYFIERQDDNTV
jgi:hypothetical protein